MKKMMSMLLCMIMVLSLTACGSVATENAAEPEVSAVGEATETVEEEATEAAEAEEATEAAVEAAAEEIAEGPTMQKIRETGVLTVGCDLAFPPFCFEDPSTGECYGIAIEIAERVAEKLDVELEIIPEAFGALLSDLQTGKLDLVCACVTVTEERKEVMMFSDPYIQTADAMIIRAEDAEQYKTLDDFKGKTIAANNGTSQYTHGESIEGTVMVGKDSAGDAIMEVIGGSADAAVVDNVNGKQYVAANEGKLVIVEDAVFEFNDKAVAAQLGNEDFIAVVNEIVAEMQPEMDSLVDKYIDLSIELLGN